MCVCAIKTDRGVRKAYTCLSSIVVLLENVHAGSAHLFLDALEERSLLKDWLLDSAVLLFKVFLGLT